MNDLQRNNKLPPGMEKGWVTFPRILLKSLRAGMLEPKELLFLSYLFLNCDNLGTCYVTTRMVAEDLLQNEKRYDYAGKILRSLKSKGFIQFDDRQGKRSSFEIKVDRFLTSGGYYTNINKGKVNSEVTPQLAKLVQNENVVDKGQIEVREEDEFRSENNKNKNIKIKEIKDFNTLRELLEKKVFKN